MKKGMPINQIRMWYYKRGWQITINSDLSRSIHRDGLLHAEVKDVNGNLFITFSKPTNVNKKNVSTNAKGKTACNAYIRLQTLLEPIAKYLRLSPNGSYFLTISRNTAKVPGILTFQILHTGKVISEGPKDEEPTPTNDTTQKELITLLGRMYFAQSYDFQKTYFETYRKILEYIIK